jgi:hypothetical protein
MWQGLYKKLPVSFKEKEKKQTEPRRHGERGDKHGGRLRARRKSAGSLPSAPPKRGPEVRHHEPFDHKLFPNAEKIVRADESSKRAHALREEKRFPHKFRVPYLRGPVSGERTAERLTLFLRALNRPPCLSPLSPCLCGSVFFFFLGLVGIYKLKINKSCADYSTIFSARRQKMTICAGYSGIISARWRKITVCAIYRVIISARGRWARLLAGRKSRRYCTRY